MPEPAALPPLLIAESINDVGLPELISPDVEWEIPLVEALGELSPELLGIKEPCDNGALLP